MNYNTYLTDTPQTKKRDNLRRELVEVIQMWNTIENRQEDLSDLGNEIGIVVGKYFKKKKMGYQKSSFVSGLNHGFSLADGTH